MDKRFLDESIFLRRQDEWNLEKIKTQVEDIFKSIELIEGFKFIKCDWVNERLSKKEELKKSVFKTLNLKIEEFTKTDTLKKEHSYNIQIPELVDGQFFFINGMLKVPIFQIYDDHIIFRQDTKNNIFLKFKNNCLSMLTEYNKKKGFVISISNNNMTIKKHIPLSLLICSLYSFEDFNAFFQKLDTSENIFLENLFKDCVNLWEKYNQSELLQELGEYRVSNINYDKEKKGKSIIFAIKSSYDIDFYTKKFMKNDCPILEIIQSLSEGQRSDTDLKNKRIRFSEYILMEVIRNVYDMICNLNYNRKIKFKISQSIIMDLCNVSEIIHFNFPYNPIGEVSSLMQCSLTGPGAFKKETVPNHLKNLNNSQHGKICPADTPDRDGCGVILNMVPGIKINKIGKFNKSSKIVCSYPITKTPFMQNDDGTRLQMASSQMKQALLLENPEKTNILTEVSDNYLKYTTFQHKADVNGIVIYKSDKFLVLTNEDEKTKIYKLGYRPLYLNGMDYIGTTLNKNDFVSKGDIICQSKYIQDDVVCLGKNLLTGVSIWEGYNYEDAIVVSESASKKLTSLHSIDLSFEIESGQVLLSLNNEYYNPLPKVGDTLKKGDIYAKIKHIISEEGIESINNECNEILVPEDCEIVSIEIYPNTWNKQIPEFKNFIDNLIDDQNLEITNLRNELETCIDLEEIDKFLTINNISHLEVKEPKISKITGKPIGGYVEKGEKLTGVFIKIMAVYKEKAGIGDKLSNFHGGKGVISLIIPDDEMPKTDDGRHLEMIINPLGIISRMNCGQLYEIHMGECLYKLKNILFKMFEEKYPYKEIENRLSEFLNIIDKTDDKWPTKHIVKTFRKQSVKDEKKAVDNIRLIQPCFQSIHPKDLFEAMENVDAEFEQHLYDRDKNKIFKNPVTVGDICYMKLCHRSENKQFSRSIGPYSRNMLQPLGGKSRGRSHKCGEMEVHSFLSHGANILLKDFLTIHSDSIGLKNKMLAKILHNSDLSAMDLADDRPQSFRLLESFLKSIGVELKE